jgi:hypothetical protein
MSLSEEAFLSPEVEALAAEALSVFAPAAVSLVRRANRFAVAVLRVPRDIQRRDSDLFAATLLGRTIQDFEGSVILATRGLRAQSRSLARSTLETALYCVAASRDQVLTQGAARKAKKDVPPTTSFVEALEGGHQRHRGQMAAGLKQLAETPPELVSSLQSLLAEIGTPGQHQDVNLQGLAEDLGLSDLYTVVYRPLSQDAHPTATSLEYHVELTPERKIAGLRIGPDYEQYGETLLLAVCALLVALDGFLERFGDTNERQELNALVAAYRYACEAAQEQP